MEQESLIDPSTVSPPAGRFLSSAAWHGNFNAVRHWLAEGLKVDEDVKGRTPILWAISAGHEDVMKLLLQKGANINRKTYEGDTALICAVWGGNPRIVKRLMDAGFDIDETGSQGKSARDWASALGNAAVLQVVREPEVARARAAARETMTAPPRCRRASKIKAGSKPKIGPAP